MASTPFDDDERPRRKADPAPRAVLGADDAPTGVLLGTDAVPTGVLLDPRGAALGAEVAPTTVVPWPRNDVPIPRDFESTHVVPWSEADNPGRFIGLDSQRTDPGGPPESSILRPTVSNKPAVQLPPRGLVALGTDVEPNATWVQQRISPLLIARPRRMARQLSTALRAGHRRIVLFSLAALLGLGLLVAAFQLTSWALAPGARSPPAAHQPTNK